MTMKLKGGQSDTIVYVNSGCVYFGFYDYPGREEPESQAHILSEVQMTDEYGDVFKHHEYLPEWRELYLINSRDEPDDGDPIINVGGVCEICGKRVARCDTLCWEHRNCI